MKCNQICCYDLIIFLDLFLTSRYGDEHKLAGFSATLQAIISFVENGYNSKNSLSCFYCYTVILLQSMCMSSVLIVALEFSDNNFFHYHFTVGIVSN